MQDLFPCLQNESSNTVKQSNHTKLALITFNPSKNNFPFKKTQVSLRNFRKWLRSFIKSRKPRLGCVFAILIVNSAPSLLGRVPLVPYSALYLGHKFLKNISWVIYISVAGLQHVTFLKTNSITCNFQELLPQVYNSNFVEHFSLAVSVLDIQSHLFLFLEPLWNDTYCEISETELSVNGNK